MRNLLGSLPALIFPVIILGGILGGVFTPTEAAAVGAAYAVIIGVIYRTLKIKELANCLIEMGIFLGAVMPIVSTCMIISWILGAENITGVVEPSSSFYQPGPQCDSVGDQSVPARGRVSDGDCVGHHPVHAHFVAHRHSDGG